MGAVTVSTARQCAYLGGAVAITMLMSSAAFAADLAPLDKWSRTMGICARIVDAAMAERPPADHAAYRLKLQSEKAEGGAKTTSPTDPVQDAYARFIDQKTQELTACGRIYRLQLQQAWPIIQELQGLDEAKVPPSDPRYMAAARVRDASDALAKAIAGIGESKQVEALLMEPLREYFLRKPQ